MFFDWLIDVYEYLLMYSTDIYNIVRYIDENDLAFVLYDIYKKYEDETSFNIKQYNTFCVKYFYYNILHIQLKCIRQKYINMYKILYLNIMRSEEYGEEDIVDYFVNYIQKILIRHIEKQEEIRRIIE